MNKIISFITASTLVLMITFSGMGQTLKPKMKFEDQPRTHNAHIATDGNYYYTVNGGLAYQGQISKFSLTGNYITSYDIDLDMRSIMYNAKDKSFYLCTYDRNIYKITDMERGKYELVLSQLYEENQASLAFSLDGKYVYYFNDGTLKIYSFPKGKLVKMFTGIDRGGDFIAGSCAVAVDGKYFYTWNADYLILNAYDLKKGKKVKSVTIAKGDYGPSLSFANGLVFVSHDGNYETGEWYGYDLWTE